MISKGKDCSIISDKLRIKESYDDIDIAQMYLSISSVPCIFQSPLRKDKHSSLSFFATTSGTILYRDFGTGESGTLYDFLSKLWCIDEDEVYKKILKESSKLPKKTLLRGERRGGGCLHTESKIEVVTRDWKKHDLEYWSSYGITKKWLEFAEVYPISLILITKNNKQNVLPADKYAYVYVEHKDNKVSLKIYQPFSEKFKWMSKHDSSVWNLWNKLPEKGKYLFITSSKKDALCLWANLGIPATSMQGEGYLPKPKVINQLKERFEKIYVFYDNDFTNPDNPGHNFGKHIAEQFDLIQIEIPAEYQTKDPSDTFKKYGKKKFRQIIKNLLEK